MLCCPKPLFVSVKTKNEKFTKYIHFSKIIKKQKIINFKKVISVYFKITHFMLYSSAGEIFWVRENRKVVCEHTLQKTQTPAIYDASEFFKISY